MLEKLKEGLRERVLVEAGAGCGKTTSIINKFLSALKSKKEGGKAYLPEQCLLLTFTDAAAREMRARIKKKDPNIQLETTFVGTFHAYCLRLLSQARLIDSQAQILSDEELEILIKEEFLEKLSNESELNPLLSYISLRAVLDLALSGSGTASRSISDEFLELKTTWETYRKKLERSLNSLDLEELDPNDWPQQALNLLDADLDANISFSQKKALKTISQNNPQLLHQVKQLRDLQKKNILTPLLGLFEKEQEIFQFLFEKLKNIRAQLSTHLTFSEIEKRTLWALREKKIKAPALSLIIVDEFQDTSPEQWEIIDRLSGANCDWYLVGDPKQSIYAFRKADIRLYHKLKSEVEVRQLATNYRSTSKILQATNEMQKLFFTDAQDPAPQELKTGLDLESITDSVVISEFDVWQPELLLNRIIDRNLAHPGKHHAVLFREWKKLYAFSEYLLTQKISFQVQGSENHLDHFLTHSFLESIRKNAEQAPDQDYLSVFYDFCLNSNPARWPQGKEWASAMERLLVDLSSKGIREWIKAVQLLKSGRVPSVQLNTPVKNDDATLNLSLLTVHGSKGLEFDFVYLPDPRERAAYKNSFEEEDIPFTYFVRPQLKSRSLFDELQKTERSFRLESEQKRLFYVAMTRSKLGLDFFLPKESTAAARAEDPSWWGIWREEQVIKRFKWSNVLRALSPSIAKFVQTERIEKVETEESFLKAQAPSEKIKKEVQERKAVPRTEFQLWGENLHAVLENWNGSDEQLKILVESIPLNFQEEISRAALAVRKSPDLKLYWDVLSQKSKEWIILREEALIEQSIDTESFRYADVLMLKKDAAIVIDWKSSMNQHKLKDAERLEKIKAQLSLYAKALKTKTPKVKAIAIGIFRESPDQVKKILELDF